MAMRVLLQLVLLVGLLAEGLCYDLSGIHVAGNRLMNNANQTVILMVRLELLFILHDNSRDYYLHSRND